MKIPHVGGSVVGGLQAAGKPAAVFNLYMYFLNIHVFFYIVFNAGLKSTKTKIASVRFKAVIICNVCNTTQRLEHFVEFLF